MNSVKRDLRACGFPKDIEIDGILTINTMCSPKIEMIHIVHMTFLKASLQIMKGTNTVLDIHLSLIHI